jgi:hypothetical protein
VRTAVASAKPNSVKLAMLRRRMPDALDSNDGAANSPVVCSRTLHIGGRRRRRPVVGQGAAFSECDRRLLELTVGRGNRMKKS